MTSSRGYRLVIALALTACQGQCVTPVPGSGGASRNVEISFSGLGANATPLLLFSGYRDGSCRRFERFLGTPKVVLERVSLESSCPMELVTFAPRAAAFGRALDMGSAEEIQWVKDAIASGYATVPMATEPRLPLRFWLVGDEGAASATRDRLFPHAAAAFDQLAAGFSFDTSSRFLPLLPTQRCAEAAAIVGDATIHLETHVNVYFIDEEFLRGRNCWPEGHPGVVFVSWSYPYVQQADLAHEIGHAMGLQLPTTPTPGAENSGGHPNDLSGFTDDNLMWNGGTTFGSLTVGQRYAMNFGARSWRNRPGSDWTATLVRNCQDSWGVGECPRLVLSQPGWPP